MIKIARKKDAKRLIQVDKHISDKELILSIVQKRVYIIEEDGKWIGWLRYNLFWDNTPFLNMLYIFDGYRLKGYGTKLIQYWEENMKKMKYSIVMTSTVEVEDGVYFYEKLGYKRIGQFTLEDDPFPEVIYSKKI